MFIRITGPDEFIFVVTYDSINGFHLEFQGWSFVTQHHSPDLSEIFLNWDGFQYRETFSASAPPESIGAFCFLIFLVCYQGCIPLNCVFLRAAHQKELPELMQHWRKFFVPGCKAESSQLLIIFAAFSALWYSSMHFQEAQPGWCCRRENVGGS